LRDRQRAQSLTPGRYDVVLIGDAIIADVPGATDDTTERAPFSWFTPIVAQADGTAARQGLTRYQPGQSIFGDRELAGDPITIESDGSLAHAWNSQPFGDLGEPIRRFTLVRRGRAAGLALDLKEAALRKEPPNGGVRNLMVSPGRASFDALLTAATAPLEVEELSWLEADPRTGRVVAEISLAHVRNGAGGRSGRRPVTGGIIVGNVFDWLARARLSSETMLRAWFRGPRAIAISGVDVQ
jgi:predicted Zn-dependent protease